MYLDFTDAVYFHDDVNAYNLMENWQINVSVTFTCSINGDVTFSRTLAQYSTYPIPTFVIIDDSNNQIIVNVPEESVDNEYKFYVSSAVVGNSSIFNNLINLYTLNCVADNCVK